MSTWEFLGNALALVTLMASVFGLVYLAAIAMGAA